MTYAEMTQFNSNQKTVLRIGIGLTLITLIVFYQVWDFDFINYDDPEYVFETPLVQGGLTVRGFLAAFTTFGVANWHPLTWLSLMADRQFSGTEPAPGLFHLTNLALHLANVLLLFLALNHMTGESWRSGLVAALFAVHPLHVESVAWVAERKDVLSAFFWMLVLWTYSHYVRTPSWKWYLSVVASFTLGLMAKPMLVTLPCVLLLLDYWPLGRLRRLLPSERRPAEEADSKHPAGSRPESSARGDTLSIPQASLWQVVREKLPLFALTAAACGITIVAQRQALGTMTAFPLSARFANSIGAYVAYLGKTIWPLELSFFYRFKADQPSTAVLIGAIVFLLGMTYFVFKARRSPWLAVGWLWYLGTLVPVIGLVQVGSQAMADRYTYIPLVGVFIMLAWSVPASAFDPSRRLISVTIVASTIACLMLAAWEQVGTWRNSNTLFAHALAMDPDNWVAHINLGRALEKERRIDEAELHYQAALRVMPSPFEAHVNLAAVADKRGDLDALLFHCRKAVELQPNNFRAQNDYGLAWAKRGKFERAIEHFRAALRLSPDSLDANSNLGLALADFGRPDLAAEQFRKVVRLDHNDAEAHNNLGNCLAESGQFQSAIDEFRLALKLRPDFPKAQMNLNRTLQIQSSGKSSVPP